MLVGEFPFEEKRVLNEGEREGNYCQVWRENGQVIEKSFSHSICMQKNNSFFNLFFFAFNYHTKLENSFPFIDSCGKFKK